jgi:sulfite dehydrogenase (cytochrome) subunit A
MIDRRSLIKNSGAAIAALGAGMTSPSLRAFAATVALPFDNGERPLVKYPQKRAMIGVTSRPPQLETPFSVFNGNVITPNDAFFVRYHLTDLPLNIDPATFTLEIKGKVAKPMKLSLAEIKKMPAVDIVAVNQCSGNSRGFFNPRVAGGQSGNGAMGNARWRGVPLKAVLERRASSRVRARSPSTAWTGPRATRFRISSSRSTSTMRAMARSCSPIR